MKIKDVINILETKYGWNTKNSDGFSTTQKLIIKDVIEMLNVPIERPDCKGTNIMWRDRLKQFETVDKYGVTCIYLEDVTDRI